MNKMQRFGCHRTSVVSEKLLRAIDSKFFVFSVPKNFVYHKSQTATLITFADKNNCPLKIRVF